MNDDNGGDVHVTLSPLEEELMGIIKGWSTDREVPWAVLAEMLRIIAARAALYDIEIRGRESLTDRCDGR